MRRIQNITLQLAALAGLICTGCPSGGVGDPCIPEDEFRTNFSGYAFTEVNVESRSFQCETRVCLSAYFNGRVSCPYGQLSSGTNPDGSLVFNLGAPDRCYLPGAKVGDPNSLVTVEVPSQVHERPPSKAVYCSCRCDGPDKNARYCECPSGFACQKLVPDLGLGGGQLAGSYCVKEKTQIDDPSTVATTPCVYPNCGKNKHPNGI